MTYQRTRQASIHPQVQRSLVYPPGTKALLPPRKQSPALFWRA